MSSAGNGEPTHVVAQRRELTKKERRVLEGAERVIDRFHRLALAAAHALRRIRDMELFRAEYPDFSTYCRERWGFEQAHAYRLCSWSEIAERLSPIGEPPQLESHARPLIGLHPEQQRRAWTLALKAETITAEVVEEAVHRVITRPRRNGHPLPAATTGTIICGDCLDLLPTLADQSIDLVVCSPPYARQRDRHYPGKSEEEYPQWLASVMVAIRPKLGPQGNVMIIAREHVRNGEISDYLLRTRLAVREVGFREIDTLIWHKPDAPPWARVDRPRRTWEYCFWFALSAKPFVDLRACGTPCKEPRVRMIRTRKADKFNEVNSPVFGRMTNPIARVADLILAPVAGIEAGVAHPSMKPTPLLEALIRTYSPVGGLVVDPFCGSGTSLVAARNTGRNWWGCDIKPEYVQIARRRLSDGWKDGKRQ